MAVELINRTSMWLHLVSTTCNGQPRTFVELVPTLVLIIKTKAQRWEAGMNLAATRQNALTIVRSFPPVFSWDVSFLLRGDGLVEIQSR